MEEGKLIIVREYRREDYSDLMRSGYPFGSYYLRPDARNWIKNLILSRKETKRSVTKIFFPIEEERTLVAYATEKKEAVGAVSLRKITDDLWDLRSMFVSPPYRGRRIASLLRQESFKLLKRMKVRKAVGGVGVTNVASIRSIKRSWTGFLSKRLFTCFGRVPLNELGGTEIVVRRLREGEERKLFEIFQCCAGRQWCDFLEITQDTYLDRIFGLGGTTPTSRSIIARLAFRKDLWIAERQKELSGFIISRMIRPFHSDYTSYLFVPVSSAFEEICRALLGKALGPWLPKNLGEFSWAYIGGAEVQDRLRELGFEVTENLVCYKYL